MSESNAPIQRPDRSKSTRSANAKSANAKSGEASSNPFIEALQEVHAVEEALLQQELLQQEQPNLGEVGNLSSAGHLPLDGNRAEEVAAAPPMESTSIDQAMSGSDHTTLPPTGNWINSSQPADLADLISLIQELNQCNSILLDRVSQLEEALERSQNALKSEMKRSTQVSPLPDFVPEGLVTIHDLNEAQEQITDLYGQLEQVHHTSQRQQIVVETLTCQLEASQERVAHLEREAALIQQRYNEQVQLLAHSENHCRDLQARLHRQQRYTLQFKAALEKSLEVSTPQYNSVEEAVAAVNVENLLPKVQQIRPWSSASEAGSVRSSWMKLSALPIGNEPIAEELSAMATSDEDVMTASESDWANPFAVSASQPFRSKFAHVKLPGFVEEAWQAPAEAASVVEETLEEAIGSQAPVPVSYNVRGVEVPNSELPAELANERLMQKLDEVVQPLADMLAQAMLKDATQAEPSQAELSNNQPAELVQPDSNPDELLNSVMSDAEDALWQDLARLIDVSGEDVVKAMSGDVSAFESINFEALPTAQPHQPMHQPTHQPTEQAVTAAQFAAPEFDDRTYQMPAQPPAETAELELTQAAMAASQASIEQAVTDPTLPNPGWPSPLVYPLRPTKKRRSLAAVELPSFLHQEPGVIPT